MAKNKNLPLVIIFFIDYSIKILDNLFYFYTLGNNLNIYNFFVSKFTTEEMKISSI